MSKFVWYDTMTEDVAQAHAFYTQAFAWRIVDAEIPDREYATCFNGDIPTAGIMPISPEARANGAHSAWLGYIGVPDLDASVRHVQQAGGTLARPAENIPGIGRFAVFADPTGAMIMLFQALDATTMPNENSMSTPGGVGWHELHSSAPDIAFNFYQSVFGWQKGDALNMGEFGTYQFFEVDGVPLGGILMKRSDVLRSFWLYYFVTENIDTAMERITHAGGTIVVSPQPVPGGAFMINARDSQGAYFGMLGPRGS